MNKKRIVRNWSAGLRLLLFIWRCSCGTAGYVVAVSGALSVCMYIRMYVCAGGRLMCEQSGYPNTANRYMPEENIQRIHPGGREREREGERERAKESRDERG